jgi:hypothetical protein
MSDAHVAPGFTAQPVTAIVPSRVHPLVSTAMQQAPDMATVRELVQLQREWEAHEQKRAYTSALVALKRDLPTVIERDQKVDYTNSSGKRTTYTHASIAHVVEQVTESLTGHGFEMHWEPNTVERGNVQVTCRLTHQDGHSETCTLAAPPDTSGNKNPAQAVASTVTLLQRYTACALLGIVTRDMKEPNREEEPGDVVDTDRNIKAAARLKQRNIGRAEAEQFLGDESGPKPISKWTASDLAALTEKFLKKTERATGEEG